MHVFQSEKKLKLTMDDDVFPLFEQPEHNIPVNMRNGTRQEGLGGQIRPIGGKEEREALIIIFNKRNSFQLIRLADVTNEDISPQIKQKIEEISNYFEDDELDPTDRQRLAEAENAKINVLLTFSPKFVEQGKLLRREGIMELEVMKPSEYVQKYL